MIQIYKSENTNYSQNGDMTLFPLEASVHPILNGSWTAEMTHPIDKEGRWKYIEEGAVVKMPSFNGDQLFRICKKEKSDSGITADMQPIFMDAKEDCFLLDVRPTEKNGQEALDIMTAPNQKYKAVSDITLISTAYYQTKNLIEAINGDDGNSFINRWGGEIMFDNYTVSINKRAGGDYGTEIRYGKNLSENGLTEEIDMQDIVTRIVPKAYNGYMIEGNSPWVDSPLIDKYPTVRYGVITFEDVKMREDAQDDDEESGVTVCDTQVELEAALKKKCEEQFEAGLDKPTVSISADMVQLENTNLYQDVKELEKVSLGDDVHCRHSKLDIVTDARVIEMEWDCIKKAVSSVVIGDFQYNYINDVESMINRVESAIRVDGTVVGQQVQGILNGVKAQLRAQSTIAKKSKVRAALFEDLDPESSTYGAMCLGTMGFEIALKRTEDGRDWDWRTFGTGKGFFADFIVAGTMLADRIRGGTLIAGGGDGKNGVIQILDESGNIIGQWDVGGLDVKKGKIVGTNITLGGRENENGNIQIFDASGHLIGQWNMNGIYAVGRYVCLPTGDWDSKVEIKNGTICVSDKNGSSPLFISYNKFDSDDAGIIIRYGGDFNDARGSTTLMRVFKDRIYFDTDTVGPKGKTGKSGRAEFSDGTYLEYENGFLVGGNTKEGNF